MTKKETTKKKASKTPVNIKDLAATKNPKGGDSTTPTESVSFNFTKIK